MTASDNDLLSQYVRQNSQDAFTELVRRHLDLVYSVREDVRSLGGGDAFSAGLEATAPRQAGCPPPQV